MSSLCKAGRYALQGCLCMGNKGSIIGKEQLSDEFLHCLGGVGLVVSPQIKQATISAISVVEAILVIKVNCGPLEHYAEIDCEKSWRKDAALLYAVVYWEGLREIVAMSDLSTLVFM